MGKIHHKPKENSNGPHMGQQVNQLQTQCKGNFQLMAYAAKPNANAAWHAAAHEGSSEEPSYDVLHQGAHTRTTARQGCFNIQLNEDALSNVGAAGLPAELQLCCAMSLLRRFGI